jgi:hypothetical protein
MSPQTPLPVYRPDAEYVSDRERDQVVHQLTDDYATDQLTLEEFERRVQLALRASSRQELLSVRADLPVLPDDRGPIVQPEVARQVRGVNLLALMGGVTRKGRWVVPPRIKVWAIMGGVELDLRDAHFTSHVTEIRILAVMGGVHIRVPPGVRLETDGVAIMGGFDDNPGVSRADSPVVRVSGLAVMGGLGTDVRPRGWTSSDDD